jgi:hypothetical protein
MLPPPRSFESRNGTFGGYEVRGWRYTEEAAWHLKVRLTSGYRSENAYVVEDGEFDPKTATVEEKMVILGFIAQWEAASPNAVTDSEDLDNFG